MSFSPSALLPILLLSLSNIFMTLAWYGHLKFKSAPLWIAILLSWTIALFEYCLVIPANRIGSQHYSLAQLKTIQEVVTLIVFVLFAWVYFGEKPTLNQGIGFAFVALGAFFIFRK